MAFGVERIVRRLWFPLTVFMVGAAATIFVTGQLRRTIEAQDRERFTAAVDQLQDQIVERLETYIAMLRAGAGAFSGRTIPTGRDFRAFTDRLELEQRYPGIQGIGFSARVPASRLPAFVAARQEAGEPEFHVWPEGPRSEYHTILYLEPLDRRNMAAIGYDMFTDPTRREAMARARDTGQPAASGVVTLVQEIDEDKQAGFLLYVPVYDGDVPPATIEERRARLRGFVYSPFRADDLFAGIFGSSTRPRAGFALFDGTPSADSLLHRTAAASATGRYTSTRTIDVAGRRWTASLFSTGALDESSSLGLVPFVSWGGSIITVLLTVLAWTQTRARERAEESEALAAAASRSLKAQTATLEVVNRTGAQIAGELDLDRLLQAVTDAATRLTEAQFGAFFYADGGEPGDPSYRLAAVAGTVPAGAPAGGPGTPLPRPAPGVADIVRSADLSAGTEAHGAPDARSRHAAGVRSYLAVPVRSRSGGILGVLSFGHPAPAVFTEQAQAIVAGIAAQAAVAIDNARLYGEVQRLLASERAARADAERVSQVKDEFLATLSHELRTPLNAVIGWAHMLSAGRLTPERQHVAIDTILRNARAQSRLVEDLLDMSRIVSGRLHVESAEVDLREVVQAAADVVRPTADAKRLDLTLQMDERVHTVRGDAYRLQQVVWNLLSNAIKFTPAGGRVNVRLRNRGERVEIRVSDSGIGIEPDFLPFVFERFRQADGSFARRHGGLGLGLSIVRSLVEMHAGEVQAWSEGVDRGSVFTLTLPGVASGEAAAGAARDAEGAPLDTGVLRGLSVLVVDDDADARALAAEVLQQQGVRVHVASSGMQALHLLQSLAAPVDLLISDLGMPQMDGYELIRRVRALPVESGSATRAIALTAYASDADRRSALTAGFDLHVAKPFTPDALVAACVTLAGTAQGESAGG